MVYSFCLVVPYSDFCDFLNLRNGDQLTLIAFPKRSDYDESACIEPIISRIILSPDTGDMDATMFESDGSMANFNPLNENTAAFTFQMQTGKLMASIIPPQGSTLEFVGAAAIISRRASDGSWLRSPAVMAVDATQRDGGYTLRQASMVAATEIQTPSDWYLNNANEITE